MATTAGKVSWLRSQAANDVCIIGLYTAAYIMTVSE